jgi:hypothetical protein
MQEDTGTSQKKKKLKTGKRNSKANTARCVYYMNSEMISFFILFMAELCVDKLSVSEIIMVMVMMAAEIAIVVMTIAVVVVVVAAAVAVAVAVKMVTVVSL